jgi:hypothetical protein
MMWEERENGGEERRGEEGRGEERRGWEGERKDCRRGACGKKGCSGGTEKREVGMDALGIRRGREKGGC